jgi:cysteine-rich repeat protein
MRSPLMCLGLVALTTAFLACATAPVLDDEGTGFDPAITGSGGASSSSATTGGLGATTDGSGGATSSGTGGKPTSGEGGGKDASASSVASSSVASGTTSSAASSGSGGSAPAGWLCDALFYGAADGCDCGCGVQDPDCIDATAASCDYCTDLGSCGLGSCPGNITPANNAQCDPVICGDSVVGPGEQCDDGNTTGGDGCDASCQYEVPASWACSTSYYGSQDGCDCGCGAPDPDCTDNTAASCDYCQDTGSCGNGSCPANINPTSNDTCI